MGPNQIPFVAIFLKNTTLFRWQQYQRKIEDQTNIPISWKRFKAFFCQSPSKSKAFVNIIWSTIGKNSQYQLKEVMDWAAHLKQLQTVFQEFNANTVISELVPIRLFRNGLKPPIHTKAKQKNCQKDIWD